MNPYFPIRSSLLSAICGFLLIATPAVAQEPPPRDVAPGKPELSVAASYLHQFHTDRGDGSDFGVDRYFLRLDKASRHSDSLFFGVGLQYELADYSFDETVSGPVSAPWDTVHAVTLSTSAIYSPNETFKFFVAPSVGAAAASGADWGDALVYGGIFWSSYRVNDALTLGMGAGLFSKQDEFSAFPVILVDWKISDRLRLSNPRGGGPAGPAGLELAYRFDDGILLAAGGAYRSTRFRLDEDGPLPGGIGEDRAFPLWARISTPLGGGMALNLHGGAMVGGRLTVEDDQGNTVQELDYDVAPFLSVTLSKNF